VHDYPELVIILAHGQALWMNEGSSWSAGQNMYMDVPASLRRNLMEYFPRIEDVADKVLWARTAWSRCPAIKGNIEKFNALPIGAAAKPRFCTTTRAAVSA